MNNNDANRDSHKIPSTFMQLLRSLEIPMAQVIDALVP